MTYQSLHNLFGFRIIFPDFDISVHWTCNEIPRALDHLVAETPDFPLMASQDIKKANNFILLDCEKVLRFETFLPVLEEFPIWKADTEYLILFRVMIGSHTDLGTSMKM